MARLPRRPGAVRFKGTCKPRFAGTKAHFVNFILVYLFS
jgi:hypothetical protein